VLLSVIGRQQSTLDGETAAALHSSSSRQQVELQAQLMTGKAAQDELDSLLKPELPKAVYEEMRAVYQVRVAGAEKHWGISITTDR